MRFRLFYRQHAILAYIRLDPHVYTRCFIPAPALANARTGVGVCLYRRWRMPVRAWAFACTDVGGCRCF